MTRFPFLSVVVVTSVCALASITPVSGQSDGESSPIYGFSIPAGFRDWKLIAVNHLLFGGKGKQSYEFRCRPPMEKQCEVAFENDPE